MVNEQPSEGGLFTFGEHLEILRKMLFRIIAVVIKISISMRFALKVLFNFALQPKKNLRQMPSYWSSSSKIRITS